MLHSYIRYIIYSVKQRLKTFKILESQYAHYIPPSYIYSSYYIQYIICNVYNFCIGTMKVHFHRIHK